MKLLPERGGNVLRSFGAELLIPFTKFHHLTQNKPVGGLQYSSIIDFLFLVLKFYFVI